MKIEIVTTEQRLKEIVPLWNDIVDNSPLNYLPEWVISWWKINKEESKEIHTYLAWDESQLMAIMPTMIECKENDAKILTFMATDVSDRQGIITNVYSDKYDPPNLENRSTEVYTSHSRFNTDIDKRKI